MLIFLSGSSYQLNNNFQQRVLFGRFEKVPILPNFKGIFFYVVDKIYGRSAFPKRAKGLYLNMLARRKRLSPVLFMVSGTLQRRPIVRQVYLVLEASSGYHPVLLSSKTRVAPLSRQSIPRLELLSGVILARLVSSGKETLEPRIQINETHLWPDSKTAILWIKGSKE